MKKAFTLIELLIVIAIIAILAGVVFANLNSARKRARDTEIKNNLSQFSKALEVMKVDNDLANVSWSNLVASASCTGMNCTTTWKDIDGKALIAKLPNHPVSGQYYMIKVWTGSNYALVARLYSSTTRYWCVKNGSAYEVASNNVGGAQVFCEEGRSI